MTEATISWLSGPVLRAHTTGRFHVSDAILVGDDRLLGEVIRVETGGIVAQVYEDTTGLRPGDHRIRVQLLSDEMDAPVTKEESTRVYSDR